MSKILLYSGGYAWERAGATLINLNCAIVGKVFDFKSLGKPENGEQQ